MFFYSTLKFVTGVLVLGLVVNGTVGFGTLGWVVLHVWAIYGVFMGLVALLCVRAILHEHPPRLPKRSVQLPPVERGAFGDPV